MSSPSLDSESSQSSSGYEDGLGRRVLAFDHETGDMLERLVLRPELCAFEPALRERMAIIVGLEDERFTRPREIERGADDRLTVVSELVAGRRLSDVLDAAAEHGIVAGLDAGLGLLLELLPALARLHDAGLAHGAIAPGRVMVTPAGQLVLLDSIYADPLERLKLTRRRLWSELRLAFPSSAGGARFDKAADLGHATMVAAAFGVGRPLRDDDYPDGIPALRQEIHEIASIRGSKAFADAVDKFFAGTLPLTGRRATASADEAAIDLRKLVRKELGINTCRTALLEFFQQVEAADAERIAADASQQEQRARAETERIEAQQTGEAARVEAERIARERADADRVAHERAEAERLEHERAEKSQQEAARVEAERIARERAEAERVARERAEAERIERERAEAARVEAERIERERAEKARVEAERLERERVEKARVEAERIERERVEKARVEAERVERERVEKARIDAARLEAERLEKARIEAERIERERLELARIEAARVEAERVEKARLEAARLERERIETARLEAERLERERIEKARLEAERIERERAETARLEAERLERERVAKARIEAERLEKERLERERAEKARLEAERIERERAEKARLEAERLERERAEKVRIEAERLERERLETERRERVARERAEKARLELERAEKARLDAERLAGERADAERRERELLDAARAERERGEKARLDAERLETERAAHARLEAEREEQEEARERAERARIEAERVAVEQQERDREREREHESVRASAPKEEARGGWLVPPDRAVKFDTTIPEGPPPAARAYPIYVPPSEPSAWTSDIPAEAPLPELEPVAAAAPIAVSSPSATAPASSGTGTIRLRDDPPGLGLAARTRAESRQEPDDENLSAEGAYEPFTAVAEPRAIPWKLIAAGVVLIAISAAIRLGYTPSSGPIIETVRKVAPAGRVPPPATPPVATGTTRLTITTEPVGAKVTIDGKPAGETPLALDTISAGRHVVVLTGAGGVTAKRTVRIEAGRTVAIDVGLFSGFALISAPFVIEVSENGKTIGSSDDQIILPPGSHTLHLANKDLGYVATETVEIQGGETTRVALDPRGRANINASPWAEVWIDGEKAGDTPLANVAIRLGVREIVFKNPQFGERKVTTTVTANAPATISVDFIK
ncbi:MAG TPA: PEGA domain-containing protein [Vicinamibacterales bacterium]